MYHKTGLRYVCDTLHATSPQLYFVHSQMFPCINFLFTSSWCNESNASVDL